ncbi:unnamed protein product [Leuciscus chuanchicus]
MGQRQGARTGPQRGRAVKETGKKNRTTWLVGGWLIGESSPLCSMGPVRERTILTPSDFLSVDGNAIKRHKTDQSSCTSIESRLHLFPLLRPAMYLLAPERQPLASPRDQLEQSHRLPLLVPTSSLLTLSHPSLSVLFCPLVPLTSTRPSLGSTAAHLLPSLSTDAPSESAESGTVTPFSIGSRSAEPQLDPSYNPPVCKCGLFPTSSSANHRASQPEDERQIWALHRFLMPLIQPISLKKQKPLSVQQSQCNHYGGLGRGCRGLLTMEQLPLTESQHSSTE